MSDGYVRLYVRWIDASFSGYGAVPALSDRSSEEVSDQRYTQCYGDEIGRSPKLSGRDPPVQQEPRRHEVGILPITRNHGCYTQGQCNPREQPKPHQHQSPPDWMLK